MFRFNNCMNKIAFTLVATLVALTLAGRVLACDGSAQLPVLVNAVNLSWGTQGGNGEETGLAVDPKTGNVYAADFDGHISVITQDIAKGSLAKDVNINPDIAAVYAANPFKQQPAVTMNTIATTQGAYNQGIALDPKTGNIYVPSPINNAVYVLNELTNSVIATITMTDARTPAVDPETGKVYVTNYGPGTVSVIDEKTNSIIAAIPVGSGPEVVVVDTKSQKAYVSNFRSGTVSVIDVAEGTATTNTVIATIPLGSGLIGPFGLAVDQKTGKVYVPNYFTENISVIDEATDTVIATIPDTGYHSLSLVADSANGTVYVVNFAKDPGYAVTTNALVIDEKTDTVTGTFNVLPYSQSLAVDEKRGLLYIGRGAPNQINSLSIYKIQQ